MLEVTVDGIWWDAVMLPVYDLEKYDWDVFENMDVFKSNTFSLKLLVNNMITIYLQFIVWDFLFSHHSNVNQVNKNVWEGVE